MWCGTVCRESDSDTRRYGVTFRFRLQNVLDYRSKRVKEVISLAEQTRLKIKELHSLLAQERDFYLQEREQLNQCLRQSDLTQMKLYESSLEKRQSYMLNLLQNLRDNQQELQHQELALKSFQQQEKIIVKLKDLKIKEYDVVQRKLEQKFLDEISLAGFYRQERADVE